MPPPPPTPTSLSDELEGRVREVERSVDRMDGRLGRVEEEVRQFRPLPLENAESRGVIAQLSKDVHGAHESIREMRDDFDEFKQDIAKVREAREEKEREREEKERQRNEDRKAAERRDRYARWIGAAALTLTFISMTVGWLILAL